MTWDKMAAHYFILHLKIITLYIYNKSDHIYSALLFTVYMIERYCDAHRGDPYLHFNAVLRGEGQNEMYSLHHPQLVYSTSSSAPSQGLLLP